MHILTIIIEISGILDALRELLYFPRGFCMQSRVMQCGTYLLVPGCSFIKLHKNGNSISENFWNVSIFHTTQEQKEQKEKKRLLYETWKKKIKS